MHCDHIQTPSHISSQINHIPNHSHFMSFIIILKGPSSLICVFLLLLGVEPFPDSWSPYLTSHSQGKPTLLSATSGSSARAGASCFLTPSCWVFFWLRLVSCACCHKSCEFICRAILWYPENTVSLYSSTTYISYNHPTSLPK